MKPEIRAHVYEGPSELGIVRESGSGGGIFTDVLVPLRYAAVVYGFYEAGVLL
jgi:hypothetical protein